MRGWKGITLEALALCGLLLMGVLALKASAAGSTVYLMAVNEKVLDTTVENMPAVMGGTLYVPYTMLSVRDSGINLGVSALYSTTRRTLLVSNGQIGVVFDTQANTAQDLQGSPVTARAMVRNSMIFVPIDWLCGYFGTISCSRVRTPYGTLIRVTNGASVLRDPDFVDAASGQLEEKQRNYLASVASLPGTPAPTAGPTAPGPSGEPSAPPLQAEVLLALCWGEQGAEMTAQLEARGERALILFPWDSLKDKDDAIRRAAAAGHTIGLLLTGETVEDCRIQGREGRRRLAEIARCPALVAGAPALDGEGRETLAREGWALWTPELSGERFRTAAALIGALDPRQPNRVELDCGPDGGAFLRSLLAALDREDCQVRQATASVLS